MMKFNRTDIEIAYWMLFAVVAFFEWTSGKGPEVGLATGMIFGIAYATALAVCEIRTRWIQRVTRKYRV